MKTAIIFVFVLTTNILCIQVPTSWSEFTNNPPPLDSYKSEQNIPQVYQYNKHKTQVKASTTNGVYLKPVIVNKYIRYGPGNVKHKKVIRVRPAGYFKRPLTLLKSSSNNAYSNSNPNLIVKSNSNNRYLNPKPALIVKHLSPVVEQTTYVPNVRPNYAGWVPIKTPYQTLNPNYYNNHNQQVNNEFKNQDNQYDVALEENKKLYPYQHDKYAYEGNYQPNIYSGHVSNYKNEENVYDENLSNDNEKENQNQENESNEEDNFQEPFILPNFAGRIYENDPFKRMDTNVESGEENEKVSEPVIDPAPISEHEIPPDVPTKPIYPGEGQWAIPGRRYRTYLPPTNAPTKEPYSEEETTPDGYETFESGQDQFRQAQNSFRHGIDTFPQNHNLANQNSPVESSHRSEPLYKKPEIGFIPTKTYSQVRKSETTRHLPRSEAFKEASTEEELVNAPRLREVVKNTRAHTVYTEEGYEDSAYDHAGHEKKAKNHEGFSLKEGASQKEKSKHKKNSKDKYEDEGASVKGEDIESGSSKEDIKEEDDEYSDNDKYHDEEVEILENKEYDKDGEPSVKRYQKVKYPTLRSPNYQKVTKAYDMKKTVVKDMESGDSEITTATKNSNENLESKLDSQPSKIIETTTKIEKTMKEPMKYYINKKPKKFVRKRPVYYWEKEKNMKNKTSEIKMNNSNIQTENPLNQNENDKLREKRETEETTTYKNDFPNLDIDKLTYKIVDVSKLPDPTFPPDLTHIKYPYYRIKSEKLLHPNSPLRYAEDLKKIPLKTKGGMEFYESMSSVQCPEIESTVDPIPDRIKKKQEKGETEDEDDEENEEEEKAPNTPRLKGLGDKIDCLKVKYFSEDPLDSPFFKEDIIETPSMEGVFGKQSTKINHRAKRQIRNIKVLETNSYHQTRRNTGIPSKISDILLGLSRNDMMQSASTNAKTMEDPNEITFIVEADKNLQDIPIALPLTSNGITSEKLINFNRPSEQYTVFNDIMKNIKDHETKIGDIVLTTPPSETTTMSSKNKRKMRMPTRKYRMQTTKKPKNNTNDSRTVSSNVEEIHSKLKNIKSETKTKKEAPTVDPNTFKTVYVSEHDNTVRNVFKPESTTEKYVPTEPTPYNNNINSYNPQEITYNGFKPYTPATNSYNTLPKTDYNLIHNQQTNAYFLRPSEKYPRQGFTQQKPYENIIYKGIRPIFNQNSAVYKFKIPASLIPLPVLKSVINSAPSPIIRIRVTNSRTPKYIKYPAPRPKYTSIPSSDYTNNDGIAPSFIDARHKYTNIPSLDYSNIDGMIPPSADENVADYAEYRPLTFDHIYEKPTTRDPYTAGTYNTISERIDDMETAASDNHGVYVNNNWKNYKEINEKDRQTTNSYENVEDTTEHFDETTKKEFHINVEDLKENARLDNSRFIGSEIEQNGEKDYTKHETKNDLLLNKHPPTAPSLVLKEQKYSSRYNSENPNVQPKKSIILVIEEDILPKNNTNHKEHDEQKKEVINITKRPKIEPTRKYTRTQNNRGTRKFNDSIRGTNNNIKSRYFKKPVTTTHHTKITEIASTKSPESTTKSRNTMESTTTKFSGAIIVPEDHEEDIEYTTEEYKSRKNEIPENKKRPTPTRHLEKIEHRHKTSEEVLTKLYIPHESEDKDYDVDYSDEDYDEEYDVNEDHEDIKNNKTNDHMESDYSEHVELIENFSREQVMSGPKHGGNYRHINDQKSDESQRGDEDDEEYEDYDGNNGKYYNYDSDEKSQNNRPSLRDSRKQFHDYEDDAKDDEKVRYGRSKFPGVVDYFMDKDLASRVNNLKSPIR